MSNGVGRGRGWLKLKVQDTKTPGSESNTSPPVISGDSLSNFNTEDNRTFSDARADYTGLISKVKQLNINDDGIKFNQKIKYIIEHWTLDCKTAAEVEQSFEAIHDACLLDADLATKIVLLVASRTFLSQKIHEQNIRLMFIKQLQVNFEACEELQSSKPLLFRNSVQMMGEFYNKARLASGSTFAFMSAPLLSYLDMLLDSAEVTDLKLFTTQLYLNGNTLKEKCPERMVDILTKVRMMLCSDNKYTKDCKLWLLLALEVASNRFALLPSEVHKFYQDQLGENAMACFQGSHGTLTVQTTENSKTLDNFQSNVNVLQVSTDSSADPVSPPNNSVSDYGSWINHSSSSIQSETSQNSSISKKDNPSKLNKGGKSGRPILGAGARLQRNRMQNNDSIDGWEADKSQSDTSSNWNRNRSQNNADSGKWNKNKSPTEGSWRDDSKKGTDRGTHKKDWDKKNAPKTKKGWEHDDRFENEYS